MDSIYYFLHTIQLRHRQPLTYLQLKNLMAHSYSDMPEEVFEAQYQALLREGLIRENDTITLTFRGKIKLKQHLIEQQFKRSD